MNNRTTISKDSLKEIYYESKQRVRAILKMLGPIDLKDPMKPIDVKVFDNISNFINSIMSSAQFESSNQYSDAIREISTWLNFAFQRKFITENAEKKPHPFLAIRKGLEILHSFLHRDLRRKQFSSEENELYQSFLLMIQKYSDPRKQRMNQDSVNSLIDELLKSG